MGIDPSPLTADLHERDTTCGAGVNVHPHIGSLTQSPSVPTRARLAGVDDD